MKAAVIQFDIRMNEVSANERKVANLIEKAANEGGKIVVLPELWNTGYALDRIETLAQDMRGSSVKLLQKLAKKHSIYIFGGSIIEKRGGEYYNTMPIFDPNGQIIEKYRKAHLFSYGLEEDKYFSAGDEWCIIDTEFGRVGVIICYDLRFSAFVRNLVLRGADIIIVAAQWPKIRQEHWLTLNRARAIENMVFLLSSNRIGKDKTGNYLGGSQIISPWGEIIADGGGEEGLAIAEINITEVTKARNTIPIFNDRRRILDEIDESNI